MRTFRPSPATSFLYAFLRFLPSEVIQFHRPLPPANPPSLGSPSHAPGNDPDRRPQRPYPQMAGDSLLDFSCGGADQVQEEAVVPFGAFELTAHGVF